MTNACIFVYSNNRVKLDSQGGKVVDIEATQRYKNRDPLSNEEIDDMLHKADKIDFEYFRLRVKAIIALAKKFGKRRSEIASLERSDLKVENSLLNVTFTIRKKHKKGLFQYFKYLKKNNPAALEKPLTQLELDYKEWLLTKEGVRIKEEKRTKAINVSDKYAIHISLYLEHVAKNYPQTKFLFPSGIEVFGERYVLTREDKHLTGRQVLRLIKPLNPSAWMHLFRETKGAEIAKQEGDKLRAVYEVRDTLDLEDERTAYRYVRRYAVQEMKTET